MRRWHWIAIALLPLMVAAVLVASPRLGGGTEQAQAQVGLYLALDMDTVGGPCADIDDSTTHAVGDNYNVGLCIGGMETATGVFRASVFYDDTLNSSANIACASGDCLDTNPDANAGSTTWGTPLGSGWDCNIFDQSPPMGDRDGQSANGSGEAYISCWNIIGPYTFGDNETTGVLAQISFSAIAGGQDILTVGSASIADPNEVELGACNPPSGDPQVPEITCTGGTDDKSGNPAPTFTPTMTPAATSTPCPNGICPTSTPTPRAWTKTPTSVPTNTAAPPTEQPTSPPPPPPPPPPSGGGLPQVVPPATGDGPGAAPWTGTALWVLVAAGALSLSLGGLCLRRARNR